jgi:2-polyprenyl-3-methyl-5-hydroxy-6-metoxy-1,4-benzoquinol methylase
MLDVYYPSLLFSYLFASNYYEILRIFRTRFLPLVAGVRSCCEIGIGHGLLTGLVVRDNPGAHALGLDVSAASPTIAAQVLRLLGIAADRVDVVVGDAIERPAPEPRPLFEAGICAEVLEHVPDPAALLTALRSRLALGVPAFLTAAINMESVDHLYLFRTDDEVVELVERAGFQVQERHLGLLSRRSDARQPEIARELVRRRNPATAILLVRAV